MNRSQIGAAPTSSSSAESNRQKKIKAREQVNLAVKAESAHVEPDKPIPGQNFWVISYVTPAGSLMRDSHGIGMKSKEIMVKNSGSFATEEEAERRAEFIRNSEPRIGADVVNMYGFVQVPKPLIADLTQRKHYMEKKMDAWMYAQQQGARRDRQIIENRKKQDEEHALAIMRKKNPNFTPPPKIEEQMPIAARVPKETKYTADQISRWMKETLAQNEGKPLEEKMLLSVMENLAKEKQMAANEIEAERNAAIRKQELADRKEDANAAGTSTQQPTEKPEEYI
jgi:hypothetical protein